MTRYSPEQELAPRDVVSRAVLQEMTEEGKTNIFLDVTHLESSLLKTRFPQIYRFCLEHGLDITKEQIPVAPAAHYMIGGVKVDSWGESSVKNLYAAGETACTGVHGANRLASNSLLEVPVFAKRILLKTGGKIKSDTKEKRNESDSRSKPLKKSLKPGIVLGTIEKPTLDALQTLMWRDVGIIREGVKLENAIRTLASWEISHKVAESRASYEMANLLLVARMVAEAALYRKESRGVHFRRDFPDRNPRWCRHIVFSKS